VTGLALLIAPIGHAHADCTAEVEAAFAKLRSGKAFRQETKITDEQKGTLSMKVDYILPDRMHQRVSLGDAPATMETIVVGAKVYSNGGQGWAEVPEKYATAVAAQLRTVAEPPKSQLAYECLGDKALEGKTFVAFSAKLPPVEEPTKGSSATEQKQPNIQTLYVDKVTGLPARNIVTASNAPDKRLFDGTFSQPADLAINEPEVKK
jgi:hypothetical protein